MNFAKHSPLLAAVMRNVKKHSCKTAIIMNDCDITYSQLGTNIYKAATILNELGLKKGDRIILSAHKEVEYIYLYFGAHVLGVINVIVDVESNQERLRYIENTVKPSFCFGYESKQNHSKQYADLNFDCVDEYTDTIEGLTESDIAEILFTTGTTGMPKGVCLSYFNIYSSASNINEYIGNGLDDVELLGLPICHSFGLGRIRCTLLKGATIVILSNFSNIRSFINAFEKYHITGFGVVPAAWAFIRKMSGTRISKYAEQVHFIEIGSAAMPIAVKKEMLEMFPHSRICMHYGLTEASRATFQEFHDLEHIDSIGKPVCDKVDVKIFNDDGIEVDNEEIGEICVKGNMVLTRYHEADDAKEAFWGDYFRTGDCGYKLVDGYVYLVGRKKELINVGGKKVSPSEVEDAIISLGVGDCVCVPKKDENGIMGELVFCYVLRNSTSLSFEDIAEKLKDKLEVYKQPVGYEWIDNIPETSSGKKQRVLLNEK